MIDVIRGSVSRPWLLQITTPTLEKHFKYSGEINHHIVESVFVKELSNQNAAWAKEKGYKYFEINPQAGYGVALAYALDHLVTAPYMINWEDDYSAVTDIPLDECVALMEAYPHINQISFNKRSTLDFKWANGSTGRFKWKKEQRVFELDEEFYPLVVKEKWWFGPAIWRVEYIRSLFKGYQERIHHQLNDRILLPMAGAIPEKVVPTAEKIEDVIGCYLWGSHGDPAMVDHTGRNQSVFLGELTDKWKKEGKQIIGNI